MIPSGTKEPGHICFVFESSSIVAKSECTAGLAASPQLVRGGLVGFLEPIPPASGAWPGAARALAGDLRGERLVELGRERHKPGRRGLRDLAAFYDLRFVRLVSSVVSDIADASLAIFVANLDSVVIGSKCDGP